MLSEVTEGVVGCLGHIQEGQLTQSRKGQRRIPEEMTPQSWVNRSLSMKEAMESSSLMVVVMGGGEGEQAQTHAGMREQGHIQGSSEQLGMDCTQRQETESEWEEDWREKKLKKTGYKVRMGLCAMLRSLRLS